MGRNKRYLMSGFQYQMMNSIQGLLTKVSTYELRLEHSNFPEAYSRVKDAKAQLEMALDHVSRIQGVPKVPPY